MYSISRIVPSINLPGFVALIGALSSAIPAVASDLDLTLRVAEADSVRLSFPLGPDRQAELQVQGSRVGVTVDGGDAQPLLDEPQPLNGEIMVTVADYDFDGMSDIGVLESHGYGGVNLFIAVYVFDPDTGSFRHWLTDSNLHVDPAAREIHAAQRSGPRYFTTTYRLHGSEPYPYREAVTIGPGLEKVTLRDETGAEMDTRVLEAGDGLPAVRAVVAERAYFHDAPDEASRLRSYIVRGDEVELLNSAGEWDEWLFVRYRGNRVFEHWIRTEAVIR